MADILIVDDKPDNLVVFGDTLQDSGHTIRAASNSEDALQEVQTQEPHAVLLDLWLLDSSIDGMTLLARLNEEHPAVPVVMISAHGNIENAVEAIEKGAITFVEKPVTTERLCNVVAHAVKVGQIRRENEIYRNRNLREVGLLGESTKMLEIRNTLDAAVHHNTRILFHGPPGSGKEEAARYLHLRSNRSDGPFVSIGAGEIGNKLPDAWAYAENGTLLIKEIADLPTEGQKTLLYNLVAQTNRRRGNAGSGVRVLANSCYNFAQLVEEKGIREDLYHRLAVLTVTLPPLRERRNDILGLATHLMTLLAQETNREPRKFDKSAILALQTYEWPGNVRELRNVIERVLIVSDGEAGSKMVTANSLPLDFSSSVMDVESDSALMELQYREARDEFERGYLLFHAQLADGKISRLSARIGMERTALYRKLHTLGIYHLVHRDGDGPPKIGDQDEMDS